MEIEEERGWGFLPDELRLHLIEYVNDNNLDALSRLNKDWHGLMQEPSIWNARCRRSGWLNESTHDLSMRSYFFWRKEVERQWKEGSPDVYSSAAVTGLRTLAFNREIVGIASGLPDEFGSIEIRDLEMTTTLYRARHQGKVTGLAVHPTSDLLAASTEWQVKIVCGAAAGSPRVTTRDFEGWVESACFIGSDIAVGNARDIRIVDSERGSPVCDFLNAHEQLVCRLAPLGPHLLASGSLDRTVKIWDTRARQCVFLLRGHTSIIKSLSGHGEQGVLSGSKDRTARLWDLRRPASAAASLLHPGCVIALSVAGHRLVSGCWDGKIRVFDLAVPNQVPRLLGSHTDRVEALQTDAERVISCAHEELMVHRFRPGGKKKEEDKAPQ